jgi:hypothetical protein
MKRGRLPYRRFMQEKKRPDGNLYEMFYDTIERLPQKPKLMKLRAYLLRHVRQ